MKRILSNPKRIFLGIAILSFLILWTLWGNTALMVSTVSISSNRIPTAYSGFRIAQVSDLHNAEFGPNNTRLLQMLADTTPDIIAITGDLVDARHTDLALALDFVADAVQIAPVYYVTGNHEARLSSYSAFKTCLEERGAIVLEDEAISIVRDGEELWLIGLSDPNFTRKENLLGEVPAIVQTVLGNLVQNETYYTILLAHRPELFDTYVSCGIDLVLSGHAHGGQIRLPLVGGLIAPNQGLFPRYDAGVYTDGNTNMVVSRGIGNSIIPLRVWNRPEIVCIELVSGG